jgi:hypothetical protein
MQTHMSIRPKVQLQSIPQVHPKFGIFEAHFNNSKRRAGSPLKYEDAYGSLYPDGTVHLHTTSVVVTDFMSLGQMREYLRELGEYRVMWIAGPLAKNEEEL